MPRRVKAMKDVVSCDKLWRGVPTRDPEISEWGNPASFYWSLGAEYIGSEELTRGSEPSQYPEEEKTIQ